MKRHPLAFIILVSSFNLFAVEDEFPRILSAGLALPRSTEAVSVHPATIPRQRMIAFEFDYAPFVPGDDLQVFSMSGMMSNEDYGFGAQMGARVTEEGTKPQLALGFGYHFAGLTLGVGLRDEELDVFDPSLDLGANLPLSEHLIVSFVTRGLTDRPTLAFGLGYEVKKVYALSGEIIMPTPEKYGDETPKYLAGSAVIYLKRWALGARLEYETSRQYLNPKITAAHHLSDSMATSFEIQRDGFALTMMFQT